MVVAPDVELENVVRVGLKEFRNIPLCLGLFLVKELSLSWLFLLLHLVLKMMLFHLPYPLSFYTHMKIIKNKEESQGREALLIWYREDQNIKRKKVEHGAQEGGNLEFGNSLSLPQLRKAKP